jgi:hypothetical protein
VSTDGRTIRAQIRLQASRATEHQATVLGGKVDVPETSLVRMETCLAIPNGGSALFLLPRRCEASTRPQVLWVRASATAPGTVGPVESADPSAKDLWARLDAAAPVDLSLKDARVEELVTFFREATGINFVVDPEVDSHLKVSFQAEKIAPREALERIFTPHGIECVPFSEAFLVGPNAGPGGLPIFVESLRDLAAQPFDATVGNDEGARQEWEPDDFANLIKNSVAKDDWDDERAIGVTRDGLLLVRQTPAVMAEVRRFLALLRAARDRRADLRLDVLDLKESEAPADGLLSAEEADRLIAAAKKGGGTGSESMHVRGAVGVRLGLDWRRSRTYVRDFDVKEDSSTATIMDTMVAASHVAIRAEAGDGGVSVQLALSDTVFDSLETKKIGKYELQTPLLGVYGAKTVFTVAPGKVQAVKLTGTKEREGERTVRVVLVRAESSR